MPDYTVYQLITPESVRATFMVSSFEFSGCSMVQLRKKSVRQWFLMFLSFVKTKRKTSTCDASLSVV